MVMVGIMFEVRMRITRPYLCVYVEKVHAAQFVCVTSLVAVSLDECSCLLRRLLMMKGLGE